MLVDQGLDHRPLAGDRAGGDLDHHLSFEQGQTVLPRDGLQGRSEDRFGADRVLGGPVVQGQRNALVLDPRSWDQSRRALHFLHRRQDPLPAHALGQPVQPHDGHVLAVDEVANLLGRPARDDGHHLHPGTQSAQHLIRAWGRPGQFGPSHDLRKRSIEVKEDAAPCGLPESLCSRAVDQVRPA